MNLVHLIQKFGSEEKCRAYLESLRWPDRKAVCPRCGDAKASRLKDRGQFDCESCRHQFSVTSGTMLHDTHLPLWKWFLAAYMIVEAKKAVSANQLRRTLDVSYRTAWYLCHRIRAAMATKPGTLKGIVEVDETWIGGKRPYTPSVPGRRRGHYSDHKTMVVGAVERGGNIRLEAQPDHKSPNRSVVGPFVAENICETATVYTDENPAYRKALRSHAMHDAVTHGSHEWVRGDVHTNTIEGAWGLFKRSIIGAYHQVSVKHLDAYLDEFEFKWNNRENPYIFRDALKTLVAAEHVEYRELVSSSNAKP